VKARDDVPARPPGGPLFGVLVMAYGTARGPEDVERYYTDIRGGRRPPPELLEDLKRRYAAIGNRFPLLEITRDQAAGLERELNADGGQEFRSYLGMKHSSPTIEGAVARMRNDGVDRAVGLVMAPHWSGMSVETYIERVEKAVADGGGRPSFGFVRSWYDHPGFVKFLSERVAEALDRLSPAERDKAAVVFSAHSLPVRRMGDGSLRCLRCTLCSDVCKYALELRETAEAVARRLSLGPALLAWQSAGQTPDPWWGPSIEEVIREAAEAGRSAVVVCSAGFVADHLETLYDLDIEASRAARDSGITFRRTRMPNSDPAFLRILAHVVREHLASEEEEAE
jgi:protoporphyrin/coproporphyrin ferrochelatase